MPTDNVHELYFGQHRDPQSRRRKPLEEAKPTVYKDLKDATERAKRGLPPRKP